MNIKLLYFLPAFIWMVLIFYLSSIPDLELTGQFSAYDFVLRKIAHMVEYASLFLLLVLGFKRNDSRHPVRNSIIIALIYATSDELHQAFVPTREAHLRDFIIDTIGIILPAYLLKYRDGPHKLVG